MQEAVAAQEGSPLHERLIAVQEGSSPHISSLQLPECTRSRQIRERRQNSSPHRSASPHQRGCSSLRQRARSRSSAPQGSLPCTRDLVTGSEDSSLAASEDSSKHQGTSSPHQRTYRRAREFIAALESLPPRQRARHRRSGGIVAAPYNLVPDLRIRHRNICHIVAAETRSSSHQRSCRWSIAAPKDWLVAADD